MDLKNKTVLITGGNSGLGFEIARQLVGKDAKVIILGKDKEKLDKAKKTLGEKASTIVCDVRNYDEIAKNLSGVKELDVLVNCASIINYKYLHEHDPQNIKDIVDANLLGTIYTTRELFPLFKKQNSGTIINVSSTSGLPTGGHTSQSVYTASKFGVYGFTEALKRDVEELGVNIRVLGFYPGGMRTNLYSSAGLEKDTSDFMDPVEVAKVVVFMIECPDGIRMDHVVINRNKNAK